MAITKTVINNYKYLLGTAGINYSSDTIKVILLNTTFVFDEVTHELLADVTANQIATNYGYTQDYAILINPVLATNMSTDKFEASFDDYTFEASGGDIGPFRFVAFYDDTDPDDSLIAVVNLGVDKTIVDGESYKLSDISFNIA